MILAAFAAVAGPALACSDGARADREPGPDTVVAMEEAADTLTLDADNPRGSIPIDPGEAAGAELLLMRVADVVNPDRQEIAISASLEDPTAEPPGSEIKIGAVALFPVDQGGTFSLRLSSAAVEALHRGVALRLVLTLLETPETPGRRSVRIRIADVEWSQ